NGATKIENAKHVAGGKRNLGDQRPLQDFFHVENRKAETLAPTAKDHELGFRRTFSNRSQSFEEFAEFGVGGDRSQLKVFGHCWVFLAFSFMRNHAKRRTARKSSSRVKGLVT